MLGIGGGGCTPLSALERRTGLSGKYLEQLLGKLRTGGIVKTVRGVNGGYYLARDASDISVNSILCALDDGFEISDCASAVCDDSYCPNKKMFKKLHEYVNNMLDGVSLQDMINDQKCK
jgi:Rrf2 family protein